MSLVCIYLLSYAVNVENWNIPTQFDHKTCEGRLKKTGASFASRKVNYRKLK